MSGLIDCDTLWTPRPPRSDEAGGLYHALNWGNASATIFRKDADFKTFERILAEGLEPYEVQLFAFQLLPNHWHLVLRHSGRSSLVRWSSRFEQRFALHGVDE